MGEKCPRSEAGIFSKVFFSWFDSVAWKGFRRPLKAKDLWELEEENEAVRIAKQFGSAWACGKDRKAGKPVKIMPALFKAFGGYYAIGSVVTVVPHLLDLLAPLILR